MTHIHRFFLSQPVGSGTRMMLASEDVFHARKVLRLAEGDAVELADGSGDVYAGRVVAVDGEVEVEAGQLIVSGPVQETLTVAQALPRARKMDLVVEKLSELGVDRLVPVTTRRSVKKPADEGGKIKRWRRIARAAAGQAKRRTVMEVEAPRPLQDWVVDHVGDIIVLATEIDAQPMGELMQGVRGPVSLVIGPESGFDAAELEALAASGARFGRLGEEVLRTETAALVAATLVRHHLGELG